MTIDSIRLDKVLPKVFEGAEREEPVSRSELWLQDVTFSRGSYYLVEAESGTGKSSLCSYIYGNRDDYSGHIYFDATDIRTLTVDRWSDLRCRQIAMLPQEMRLFPELTAYENVQIKNRLTGFFDEAKIRSMFERAEIADRIDTQVSRLSIGQQQRVAIIRALAQPFSFILLDEPVSHLDSRNNQIVADMILEHAIAQGAGIITTSVGNPLQIGCQIKRIQL